MRAYYFVIGATLLAACGKSGSPTTAMEPPPATTSITKPTTPDTTSAASEMLRSLDGRWTMAGSPIELHYSRGRLLGRGQQMPNRSAELFVVETAGELDSDNHQVPITLTALVASCHDQLLPFGNKYHSDLEEQFDAKERLIFGVEHGASNAPNPQRFKAEELAELPALRQSVESERDAIIQRCHPSEPSVTTMTLKNYSVDPSSSISPGFLRDSDGGATKLSFIRKLTPTEAADIEKMHASHNEDVTKSNAETIDLLQDYYNSLIAKIDSFEASHDEKKSDAPSSPSVASNGQNPLKTEESSTLPNASSASSKSAAESDLPSKVVSPSFDCSKAISAVEKMICSDPALAEADNDLAAKYARAKAEASDSAALRNSQRQFIQSRNSCTVASCVADAYRARESELVTLANNH